MSSLIIQGDVSGSVTLQAPSAAGSTVVNLPSTLGNTGASSFATTDASGNLGLGVTPSAWNSSSKVFQNGPLAFETIGGNLLLGTNYYRNSSNVLKYIGNGYASVYVQQNSAHLWYTAPSGTAGNPITFTQAMTLNASGNLGIGTTSPSCRLDLANPGNAQFFTANNGVDTNLNITFSTNTTTFSNTAGSGNIAFATGGSGTERARIDSSGNFLFGATSTAAPATYFLNEGDGGAFVKKSTSTNTRTAFYFYINASLVGSISTSGSSTTYSTSSDYRLKDNIAPMTGALTKVSALKPCTYTWKADGSEGQGFIAHELQEVLPDAVVGEKDAVNEDGSIKPQGIDTSFLVATLTAAIQEQQTLIQQLQADVAALKGA